MKRTGESSSVERVMLSSLPSDRLTLHQTHQTQAKDYKTLLDVISILPACEATEQYPRPPNDSFPIEDLIVHR
jgi:hypothetical protein